MRLKQKSVVSLWIAAIAVAMLGPVVVTAGAQEGNQEIMKMVIDALKSPDAEMQTGAIAIVREIGGAEVTKALAQELPNLGPTAQVQLLSALADRGDALALPAVIEAGKSKDESVRVAALKAVGQLGNASSVPLLAERAASSKGVEQKAARESLYRLRGAEVDAAVLQNLAAAKSEVKVELVSAVGERNIAGSVETLLKAAKDEDRKVRTESLKVLRGVGKPEDMPALVNLLLEVKTDSDRTEAEKTVAIVAHKIEDATRQAAAVLQVLPNVKDNPNRASLLRVLGRIGDSSALPTLRTALTAREAEIQDAAIRALSDWPTAEPVPDLLKVAQTSESAKYKVLALRGFVRLLGLASDRSAEETIELYKKAMELAGDAQEKKRVLSGLASAKSLGAMNMAAQYLDDLPLHLEAESATVQIARSVYGADPARTKEILAKVVAATKQDAVRQQAQEVIGMIERFDDYIVAWQVSGPYTKDAQANELIDTVFPPEQEGQQAQWQAMPAGTTPASPWLVEPDKVATLAGDKRVAYLRTTISSPKEQKARLEVGSDDGVKIWLNGQVVHANNAERAVQPGEDKVDVTLKEGANSVLVKLVQNAGQWAMCLRFRAPDGGKLEGLKVEP
ncbi:MAG TPA: HEAT repeat domain-containing protein [Sedimentisphaerales bacterium]|jgi:HEAT repeat protein|nr:HEAT repeat domain-containing protein [Sedimentisphaerales bacterium]HNU27614.1 HEAT repeat domain-containing protein [Sedimentisphaerales bacterium]